MDRSKGVPPHVKQCMMLQEVLEKASSIMEEVKKQTEAMKTALNEVLEARAVENGQVTSHGMKQMFEGFWTQVETRLDNFICDHPSAGQNSSAVAHVVAEHNNDHFETFEYENKRCPTFPIPKRLESSHCVELL
eukprot:CAMPEP_0202449176 /NCGR_PEP_ID=MMETSP1360-20130828/7920_1 /ASSEMBLY_ACC=CAM_ASM_000848 /TAXON_ID=515479 /ORGANISM="Licmophora paradoxa, Strain CCMP2313" /LENGTH=133 /DNA_ID=CAMNT_0049067013 /DNA_START=46 /DNA_END=443 /DNA_ORIENTATION=-